MRVLIYKARENEFVATPIGSIPICAQGSSREEVIDDLKQQLVSVIRLIVENDLHFEDCKDEKEWTHHEAIEAEKIIDKHESMYNYKPVLYKRDGGN